MPFIPAARTVQAELRFTWDSQNVENTLYFQYADEPTTGQMFTLAGALLEWWQDNIKPLVAAAVELREIHCTLLSSATAPAVTFPIGAGEVGGQTSPSLPNNVSLAVSFRTAGRGRSSRGRNYVLGLTEGQVTANQLDVATAANYSNAYGALIGLATENDCVWSVVSRFTNNNPRSQALVQPIVSVLVVDRTVDSQRRRLPGRGS
jgi:hypothetical protein